MLSWYRSQIAEHGLWPATKLALRVAASQGPARLANRLLPARRRCPCCGWQGRRFYDYLEIGYRVRNAACPRCDSHSRHRALFVWGQNDFRLPEKKGRALIFAPERALQSLWAAATELRLLRVDIAATRGVDFLADAQRLPLPDDSFDLVWCHHVLEQVPDDRAALSELRRILRPDTGELVISAGMQPRAETVEFGFADKRLSGNRRSYGQDFAARVAAAGFSVTTVRSNSAEAARYGINPDEVFFVCRKI
jgi:SAM-dependent methyltransferase